MVEIRGYSHKMSASLSAFATQPAVDEERSGLENPRRKVCTICVYQVCVILFVYRYGKNSLIYSHCAGGLTVICFYIFVLPPPRPGVNWFDTPRAGGAWLGKRGGAGGGGRGARPRRPAARFAAGRLAGLRRVYVRPLVSRRVQRPQGHRARHAPL